MGTLLEFVENIEGLDEGTKAILRQFANEIELLWDRLNSLKGE